MGTHADEIQTPHLARYGWLKWPLLLAFWTLPAVLLASTIHFMWSAEGETQSWWDLFAWQAVGWYFWALATPVVLWLSRVYYVGRWRWWRITLTHLGFALGLAVLHVLYLIGVTRMIGPAPYAEAGFVPLMIGWMSQRLHLDLLTYGALLGIGYGLDFYRKYRERALEASQLEAQLAQAQLQALKMQLHPHFLFNTLHAISVLVRKDANQDAVRMLAGLSDLLRLALENTGNQVVSVKQELEFLGLYLDLEQIRFQDRLKVEMHIDPATLDARIPNLILQPLVENAIRHGIAETSEAGLVHIRAWREKDELRVEVRDDGPGLARRGRPAREGVGLSNTRKRLQRLYGEHHSFSLTDGATGGAVASLAIPFGLAGS